MLDYLACGYIIRNPTNPCGETFILSIRHSADLNRGNSSPESYVFYMSDTAASGMYFVIGR